MGGGANVPHRAPPLRPACEPALALASARASERRLLRRSLLYRSLSAFDGRTFLADAGANLVNRRAGMMLTTPNSGLVPRLEREWLDVGPGHDEMVADALQG
jgi:hypothetical protein